MDHIPSWELNLGCFGGQPTHCQSASQAPTVLVILLFVWVTAPFPGGAIRPLNYSFLVLANQTQNTNE